MAWFLALQGPGHTPNQSTNYELQDSVDVERIAHELVSAASLNGVVPIPVVLRSNRVQNVTVYVRPAVWGTWTFFEMSEEDRRQVMETINALQRAAQQAQQQRGRAPQTVNINPLTGQAGPATFTMGTNP